MSDSGSHSNEGSVLKGCSLQDGVWTYEDMVANADVSWDVNSVLNDWIVANIDSFVAQQSGSVPNGWLLTCSNVSNDSGVWSDEISLLKLGSDIFQGEISETGYHSIFGDGFALDFGTNCVESLSQASEDGPGEFLLNIDHDFVDNVFHFSLLIFDDL